MRKALVVLACSFVVLAVLGTSGIVLAAKGGKKPQPPAPGTEYRITDELQQQGYPRISGNIIVWGDQRDGEWDVYMYNLGPDGEPFTSDDGGEFCVAGDPDRREDCARVSGNIIVYRRAEWDHPVVNWDLYMYHLGPDGLPGANDYPEGEYRITQTDDSEGPSPVSGRFIPWKIWGQTGILVLDLGENEIPDETDPIFEIPNTIDAGNPGMSDRMLVYDMAGDLHVRQYGADGRPSEDDPPEEILVKPGTQWYPRIFGDTLVWTDDRGGNWDVYMEDLETREERQISSGRYDEIRPRIWGSSIVWEENVVKKRSETQDVYMFDLLTDETHKLTDTGFGSRPNISGGRIVYGDVRDGNKDVYLYILTPPEGGPQSSAHANASRTAVLFQNTPNPFRHETTIRFTLRERTHTKLTVHDVTGRTIATLVDSELSRGFHSIAWNPAVTSGTYFCRIKAGDFTAARRMTVIR